MARKSWVLAAVAAGVMAGPAWGWGARGHRLVTQLALDGLSPEMPAWLHDPQVVARIMEQSSEPDRWRGTRRIAINHDANTDHYMDVEDLAGFGMTLQTVPRWRYEFVKQMTLERAAHPEKAPYDASRDSDHTKEWPGFVAHAMDEHFAKLQSSFNTLRTLEAVNDPARAAALQQARENVIYEMGILSHFVGDTSQPLHTTKHHHGWIGENPNGYTRDNGFHAYIDTKVLEVHDLTYDNLKSGVKFDRKVNTGDPWPDMLAELQRSFDAVEPLYKLQKSGELEKDAGKAFITERLTDGATMLAALYNAAWEDSKPSQGEISNYIKYTESKPAPAK